jgi:hypothetical protein
LRPRQRPRPGLGPLATIKGEWEDGDWEMLRYWRSQLTKLRTVAVAAAEEEVDKKTTP